MKMRFAFLLMAFAAIVSCQKEVDETLPEPLPPTNKIKTYTEDITSATSGHIVESFNLTYDAQNRLIGVASASQAGTRFQFGYPSATKFTIDLFNANELIIHEDAFLNDQQLVDSSMQYNNEGDTSTEKYIYNAAKQLMTMLEYDVTSGTTELWNTTNYQYDNDGNLSAEIDDFGAIAYEYDIVVPNTVVIGPAYKFAPKQLPTKQIYTAGSEIYIVEHTYKFDDQQRLTEDKAVGSNGDVIIKTYTY